MASVTVDGATLEFEECGEGRDMVLVHGSASDHRTWATVRPLWCERFHVVSYSRRYHGPNDPIPPGSTYALDEHAEDLERVLAELAPGGCVVVGHSYGGVVALRAAARSPELIDALVLVEPPVLGLFVRVPPSPVELLRVFLRRPALALGILKLGARGMGPAADALRRGDEEQAMRRMGRQILGAEAFASLGDARRDQVRENLILEELTSPEALPRMDDREIRSLDRPVLLVGGERSPALFGRLLDHLETLLPDAERVTISGASHLVHEDRPRPFARAVEAFVDGLAA